VVHGTDKDALAALLVAAATAALTLATLLLAVAVILEESLLTRGLLLRLLVLVFLPLRLMLLRLLVLRRWLLLLAIGLVLGAAASLVPLAATAAAMAALSMLVGLGLVGCLRRSGVVGRRLRLILLSCHVLHFLCDWLCVLFRFAVPGSEGPQPWMPRRSTLRIQIQRKRSAPAHHLTGTGGKFVLCRDGTRV
jgi:hypothetical protein